VKELDLKALQETVNLRQSKLEELEAEEALLNKRIDDELCPDMRRMNISLEELKIRISEHRLGITMISEEIELFKEKLPSLEGENDELEQRVEAHLPLTNQLDYEEYSTKILENENSELMEEQKML